MRHRNQYKQDANHSAIAARYEEHLCSPVDTAMVGRGFPDLIVGIWTQSTRVTDIVEVKNPDGKDRSEETQSVFDLTWRGRPRVVVRTLEDVDRHVARVRAEP